MTLRHGWAVALPILAAMLAASAYVLILLPPGTRIATHFGIDGQPDGWSAAWIGVLAMPLAGVCVSVVISILPRIDPRWQDIEDSMAAIVPIWGALMIVLAAAHAAILLSALGQPVDTIRLIVGSLGLFYAVLGNFLGKIRWNYTFGIRTPWTQADEQVWDKTHRFAGRLLFLVGVIAVLTALIPLTDQVRLGATMLPIAALPVVVLQSFLIWRRQTAA